jgi:hypothetical protein
MKPAHLIRSKAAGGKTGPAKASFPPLFAVGVNLKKQGQPVFCETLTGVFKINIEEESVLIYIPTELIDQY